MARRQKSALERKAELEERGQSNGRNHLVQQADFRPKAKGKRPVLGKAAGNTGEAAGYSVGVCWLALPAALELVIKPASWQAKLSVLHCVVLQSIIYSF